MAKIRSDASEMLKRAVGLRLRALRDHHEMEQTPFAASFKVKQAAYSKWENGERYPDPVHMIVMCHLYKVDFNYLYLGTFAGMTGDMAIDLKERIERLQASH